MFKSKKGWKIWLIAVALVFILFNLKQYSNHTAQALNWLFNDEAEDTLSEEDIQIIQDVYNSIQELYIEDLDKEQLMEGALKGMVDAVGDPYSEYLNTQESESMNESVEGSFQGIGVQFIQRNGEITVITPIDGTPAQEAGILPNDVILEADGVELTGMDTNEVVHLIRGEEGTEVNLLIKRGNSEFSVDIVRAEIPIITVEGELYPEDDTVGIVKMTQFNSTTYGELVETIEDLRDQGAESFIFDLRYNPGGLLDQALEVSNIFLEEGDIIMHMEEYGEVKNTYTADNQAYSDFKVTEPYAILINDGSASASEIVTAAVKENTESPILGTTTFGKGSVQTVILPSDYGELKLTFAKWLTPSENWIHDVGIEPTYEIPAHPITQALILDNEEVLTIGMANDQVKSVISILDALGYEVNEGDYFDEDLQAALEEFQEDNDLAVDGEVTGETASLLNDMARDYINNNDQQLDQAVEYLQEVQAQDRAA